MKKQEWYTVVGMHLDNEQVYVDWARASSASEAAETIVAHVAEQGGDIYVLAVFRGQHRDVYFNR